MEARITLKYDDARTAKAIANAISPDNFKTPARLFIKTLRNGDSVVTEIRAEEKIATFIATIDDLLSSATTAEKALRVAKEVVTTGGRRV